MVGYSMSKDNPFQDRKPGVMGVGDTKIKTDVETNEKPPVNPNGDPWPSKSKHRN